MAAHDWILFAQIAVLVGLVMARSGPTRMQAMSGLALDAVWLATAVAFFYYSYFILALHAIPVALRRNPVAPVLNRQDAWRTPRGR